VVDDVVQGGGQLVPVGIVEREPARPALAEPVDDVVRDAIAGLLAEEHVAREVRALGVFVEQVTQEHARPLDVASRILEQVEERRVRPGSQQGGHALTVLAGDAMSAGRSRVLHNGFTPG